MWFVSGGLSWIVTKAGVFRGKTFPDATLPISKIHPISKFTVT